MKTFLQTLAKVICIILFSCSVSFAQVTFSVSPDSLDTTTGSNVCLDVTVSGFSDIMTMQYSMNYNPAVLSFTGAQNFNLANFNSTNIGSSSAGDLTFSWLSDDVANGSSVSDGTSIYQLCFDVIGTSLTETTIEFSGSPTPIEIIEATGSLVNMIGENGIVTVDGGGIVPFLDFTVELDDVSVDAGNNICVPVQVHQFEQIAGAQFSINYDANVLSYTGSANLNLANLSTANIANPSAGMITFSWFTDDMSTGTTVNDGASIFDLCFDAIGNSGEMSVLEVSSNPTPIEVFDVLGDFINVNEVDGSLTINNIVPVADFEIEITDFVADPCDDICVPVLVHEFTNIGGAQFSINYDPAILSYAEAINLNLANLAAANIGNPSPGEITFSWFTDDFTNGTSVANGTPIFEVCFDAIGDNGDMSAMDISGNPTAIEVFDNTGALLNVVENDGSIVVGVDNIAPEALCQDVTVVLDGNGVGSTTAELVDNGSNDACGIASLVLSQTAFECNHVGIVNVVLTATDNDDNSATCNAEVLVVDNEAPVANCPTDLTVDTDAGSCDAVVTYSIPVPTDNCSATSVADITSGSTFVLGSTTVTVTATDGSGNTNTCTFNVLVNDNEAPVVACDDVTIQLDVTGEASITTVEIDNGSTDNCGIQSLALSQTDFDCTHVGTVDVVLTVTDNNNNVSTCDAVVTVEDNIAPEALCQDVTVQLDVDGIGSTTAELVDNGSTDACGIASLVLSQTDFDCSHVGTLAVVLTVTDNNNNVSTCDAVVTVEDNIAPEALCQDVNVQLDADGIGGTSAELVDNGSTDACGIASLVLSQTDFDCSHVGTVDVVLTVTDNNDNISTCDAVVTVEDNIAPEAICQDVTVELDENGVGFTSANLIDNGSNDACGITSIVLSQTAFDCSHVGAVTVTLTVTDVNTNSATCDAIVSVEDNLAPVMDCPSITVNLAPGLCGQVVDYTVEVSDNCGVESLVLLAGVEPGTYLDYHDSPWTADWEATDVNGNTSNCTVQIEMFEYANPSTTLACNNNVEIALDEMGCTSIGADMILEGGPYGCYDDYIVSVANGNAEVCCDAVGSTLSVTVTDPDTGNNCSGTISVVDHLAPTCVSIEDYTIACQDEIPSADDLDHVGYPVFEDNCAVETVLLVSETFINNDICVAPGIQLERKWLAIDVHGNAMELADACTQIITIERTAITFPVDQEYDCSEYSLEDLNPDLTGSPFPASFETCMYTVSYSDQVFESCGGLKKIFRTWSVWDMCSDEFITIDANGTSNVQLISLIDTEAPQIDLEDMTLSTDVDQCAFTGFIALGSVTDNCTGVETVQLFIEGVSELEYVYNADGQVIGGFVPVPGIGLGDHTLKVVASDSCANASEVLVTVSIEDQITPTAICDELTQVALTSDGTATVFAETFDNGSYDNCCLESIEVRRMEDTIFTETVLFDCEDLTANHQVVLRVNDCYGNSNTCMVEVLVEDKLFPYLTVPSNQEISCEIYYTEIAAALETGDASVLDELFGTATFGDNCSADTTYAYTYNVDQCGVGSIIRTWTVTDGSGNGPISGTQTISIYHVSDWEVSFPGEITVNCTDGELPAIGEPTITGDNCEVIAVTYTDTQFDIVSGACYKIIREWSVINWCTYPQEPAVVGTQIINVEDTEAPIFDVEDFTVEILEADCDVEVTLPTPDVSDCSDDITITVESVLMDGEVGPGVYTANYTVNDGCGNYSYDEVLVTVVDAKDPTPYVTDELVTEIMASGETLVVEATDFDIASFDNCTDVSLSFSSDVNHIDTVFTCDNLGPNTLEIWVTDAYGNQDYAIVTLTVQDNLNTCNSNQLTVAGVLNTEAGEGIEGAMVEVNGGAYTQSSMTDGSFEFALPFGGDYTVAPILDTDVSNGVSTLDMVLINQHILGLNDLDSPYQMIAADANNSNSISTLDLVVIRMVILQMADAFPNNTSWRFVDADHVFVDPANPWDFPEVINYNDLEVNKLETDFIGVKIGDVNGSAQANFMSPAENRSSNSFELKTMDKQVSAGDEVRVTLQSDARISGMQFTLEHDGLEYKGMEAGLMRAEHIASHESALTFSWNEFELKDLRGEDLVTLIFEAKSAIQLSESLVITSSMTKAEGYTEQGIESVDLVFENNKSIANVLYQNVPNPFDEQTVVNFRLNKAGKVQILITDVDGKLIQEIEGTYPQGLNSVELDRIQKAGVYYYQLYTEGFTATKKLIKI